MSTALAGWAAPAGAQRLLDLDPRVSAGSEAILGGAVAVFWNPGAIAALERRAEATVIDVRAPRSTGLGGIAIATALRIGATTTVALGYQHVGIEGIERTSGSPLPGEAEGMLDLAENVMSVAAARTIREDIVVGAGVHYTRAADLANVDDAVELATGIDYRPAMPFAPRLGLATRLHDGRVSWIAGIEVAPLAAPAGAWTVTASYGAAGGGARRGVGHRVATAARWNDRIAVSAGLAGDADGEGTAWAPVASAELRIARYQVGVLRESLPNDFGAMYALRFTVQF
ncbi:MAG: hypothetical protein ACRELX_13605 [Longimicrobiales bacterium]